MNDTRDQRAAVPLMVSVCTGSLVYAAAGLLVDRRATTHWASLNLLSDVDPTVITDVSSRFVDDGDLITSAGVRADLRNTHHTRRTVMTTLDTTLANRTMRAVVQDRYGTAEVLRLGRVPRPDIGDSDVLIQVRAAGLDRGTEHLMTGKPYAVRLAMGLRRPRNPVPGRDVAGTVVQIGAAVTRFVIGDEVYGVAPGSFAEYTVASESRLAHKPTNLSFTQAAVVPVSAATALRALVDVGRVQAGQSVLVIGASGGVGSYAVQIAKALGAEVTGVCSTAKADLVASLGADRTIDYVHDDFADGSRRYDLILDIAGNPRLTRLRRALKPHGTVVFVGGENAGALTGMGRQLRGALLSTFVQHRLALLVTKERCSDYERLTKLIEAGQLVPSIDRTYPLDDAPLAVRQLEAGHVRGKVAITIDR